MQKILRDLGTTWITAVLMTALVTLTLLFLPSCTRKEGQEQAAAKQVNLAIWSNYVSPELLAEFEKKTGIKVNVSNYSSNEELLAKLQAGATGYDVIVPSDYMIFVMKNLGLLQKLDYSKLPNAKALDPRILKKAFDPANEYSVPYDWGTTGIAVNRGAYAGEIKGWKDVFESPELKGKFTLLDDPREAIGMALRVKGHSLNSKDPDKLKDAKELLMKIRSDVKGFTSEPMMPLVNGETAVAQAYMSDALQARRKTGGRVEYILPSEGGTLWIDNLAIPKSAGNVEAAHQFMNFLLDEKSNVTTVENVLVAPANKNVFALLPKHIQSDKALFPDDETLKRFEMMEDLGEATALWDRTWTEVKSGQ